MLFDRREMLRTAADKFSARQYVREILGPDVLPELYFVTDQPETIPFDALPKRFVVKATHGAGWVRLVPDKQLVNYSTIVKLCHSWLRSNYFYRWRERPYRTATPRIFIEEFLGDENGTAPTDFKFFVFDGRVRLIQVDENRFSNHCRLYFDPDWRKVDVLVRRPAIRGEVRPPLRLADMIDAAQRLSRGIDFLRVDLYNLGERIVFGEMTMTPGAAMSPFVPTSFDYELGRYWRLPRHVSAGSNR